MPHLPESAEIIIPKSTDPVYQSQRERVNGMFDRGHLIWNSGVPRQAEDKVLYPTVYVAARVDPYWEVEPTGRRRQLGWVTYPDLDEGVPGLHVPDLVPYSYLRCIPQVNDIIVTFREGSHLSSSLVHVEVLHPRVSGVQGLSQAA